MSNQFRRSAPFATRSRPRAAPHPRDSAGRLARTRAGYANLARLFTLANAADRRAPRLDPACLPDHAAGLILLTGGRGGPLTRLAEAGRYAEAAALLGRYREWFGPEAVYVELTCPLRTGSDPVRGSGPDEGSRHGPQAAQG